MSNLFTAENLIKLPIFVAVPILVAIVIVFLFVMYSEKTSVMNSILMSSFVSIIIMVAALIFAFSLAKFDFIDILLPIFVFSFAVFLVYRLFFTKHYELF